MSASEIFLLCWAVLLSLVGLRLHRENRSLRKWFRETNRPPAPETQEAKDARLACAREARKNAVDASKRGSDGTAASYLEKALEFERGP